MKSGWLLIFSLLLGAAYAGPVLAADIKLESERAEFKPDEEFVLQMYINTEGQEINALEGNVLFPSDLLLPLEVRDGDSALNFWLEKPAVAQPGMITFSGITAGGFTGAHELILSIAFKATGEGASDVHLADFKVLLNDGRGTPVKLTTQPFVFSVNPEAVAPDIGYEVTEDTEPPEDFEIRIASDPNVFDGDLFLVFATQDKGSGIDHYEVKEGVWGNFVTAESPYVLKHQTTEQQITVKAIDNSGNERTVVLGPTDILLDDYHKRAIIGAILVMAGVSVAFVVLWLGWKRFVR